MPIDIFSHLRGVAQTPNGFIMLILGLILGAMMIDFLTGTAAARVNPGIVFRSKEGINGILRKLASIALLAYCIPLSVVLPEGIGLGALQVLYMGYLLFELASIVENLKKLGVKTEPFEAFVRHLTGNKPKDGEK